MHSGWENVMRLALKSAVTIIYGFRIDHNELNGNESPTLANKQVTLKL